MFAICSSTGCAGFILARGDQWEAFDSTERSLGVFAEEQAAVDAILNYATDSLSPNEASH
jgi:hypothetical protein